jgi:Ca2+-binding EF-hand superfamily protein
MPMLHLIQRYPVFFLTKKSGKFDAALDDANRTIALKSDYYKGYYRKGSAYFAMKKYDQAIAAYKEGLKIFPCEDQLKLGLAAAKRAKVDVSSANKSARKTFTAQRASKSRGRKAKEAPTVSEFVKETRQQITLQMAALQAQLDLINELAEMSDEDKSALLFNLIDRDGDGTVDAGELATALRKRNNELSFGESLERAIGMVAAFDADGDAKLDTEEFTTFILAMVQELGLKFSELAEFLVLQLMFSGGHDDPEVDKEIIAQKVIEQEELMDVLTDPRLIDLFKLFDSDESGSLCFAEVALGLFRLAKSMSESAQATMEVLLMMDQDDDRMLTYDQFARLVLAFVACAGSTFDEIADNLVLELTRVQPILDEDVTRLVVSNSLYKAYNDFTLASEQGAIAVDALGFGRLQRLFDLWDVDGDGSISFSELTCGLRNFQSAAGISDDAEKRASELLAFEDTGGSALSREAFVAAIVDCGEAYQVCLHDLIDFMCVITILGEENTKGYKNAFRQTLTGLDTPLHPVYPEPLEDV